MSGWRFSTHTGTKKDAQKGSTNHVSSTSNDQLPRHLRARRRAWRCPLGCLHFARCHLPPWTQRLHQHHHLCPICKRNMYTNKIYQKMYRNVHLPSLAGHNIFTVMFFSTSELFVWRTDLQPADPTAEASASADSDSGSKRWRWQWCMYLSWYGYESKYINIKI